MTCSRRTKGAAPEDAEAQYGRRVAALIIYLYIGQFLSKKRAAQALAELFGTPCHPHRRRDHRPRRRQARNFTGRVRD
jgi:hypothetical protein